jgi:hypothetical protein
MKSISQRPPSVAFQESAIVSRRSVVVCDAYHSTLRHLGFLQCLMGAMGSRYNGFAWANHATWVPIGIAMGARECMVNRTTCRMIFCCDCD